MNQWIESHRTLVFVMIGLLLIAAIVALVIKWQTPAPVTVEPPPPTATPGPLRVYVSGAVIRADVYELPPDSIVRDALNVAGGAAGDADLDRVNLAAALHDGDQIYIPRLGEMPTPAPVASDSDVVLSIPTGPINITDQNMKN